MNVLVFTTLCLWVSVMAIAPFFVFKKQKPRKNYLNSVPETAEKAARKILKKNPDIENQILEIIAYEKNPGDEKLTTRASILRAKLKIHIRNPVVRLAVIEIIKKRKNI